VIEIYAAQWKITNLVQNGMPLTCLRWIELISPTVLGFSFKSRSTLRLHQRGWKVQYLVEPRWQQHLTICSSERCIIQKNNSIKNTEGARLDLLLDKSEVCSPSTTPRIQKPIEEYDITAKILQNQTYILKKSKSHTVSLTL
jgi:hypothetical protein